jgi:hypothetical protein
MSTMTPVAATTGESPELSEVQRLAYTFTSPTFTFNDLKRHARWLGPWLVIAICSLASSAVLLQRIDARAYILNELNESGRADMLARLPPERQESQLRMLTVVTTVRVYAAPVLMFLGAMAVAALLMVSFDTLFQAGIPFRRCFAIMSYALLPLALGSLLVLPIVWLSTDPQQIDLRSPLMASPAVFLEPASGTFLYELASSFDLFQLWVLGLLGLGFHLNAKSRSVSQGMSTAVVYGLFLLWIVARSAVVAAVR